MDLEIHYLRLGIVKLVAGVFVPVDLKVAVRFGCSSLNLTLKKDQAGTDRGSQDVVMRRSIVCR
jgi:hypothetical protein